MHIKLFIAANICVKQAQNRGIWRRTGPSEVTLNVVGEFVTVLNSNYSRLFRMVNGFIILFYQVFYKQA